MKSVSVVWQYLICLYFAFCLYLKTNIYKTNTQYIHLVSMSKLKSNV